MHFIPIRRLKREAYVGLKNLWYFLKRRISGQGTGGGSQHRFPFANSIWLILRPGTKLRKTITISTWKINEVSAVGSRCSNTRTTVLKTLSISTKKIWCVPRLPFSRPSIHSLNSHTKCRETPLTTSRAPIQFSPSQHQFCSEPKVGRRGRRSIYSLYIGQRSIFVVPILFITGSHYRWNDNDTNIIIWKKNPKFGDTILYNRILLEKITIISWNNR